MLETGRPGKEVLAAMAAKEIYIGRIWPAWPTQVRITVGTHGRDARLPQGLQGSDGHQHCGAGRASPFPAGWRNIPSRTSRRDSDQ